MLRAYQQDLSSQKRIVELNPKHPIVERLKSEFVSDKDAGKLSRWVEMPYDQARLT